ncbi:hypothetical protein FY557_12545 [Chryseobacterium sp. SN22]|uniref:hypothetical protein n=1 Tax=Chryseobacterium sp. SN22 TaxID=2606431 RepID=UPI0011ECD343|nr:hypothetical protein [Chryseobacterium sp. SN22]KAA0127443.1 hypothetical protein FY557_12545 [Chryseobacterium sp. SN22]
MERNPLFVPAIKYSNLLSSITAFIIHDDHPAIFRSREPAFRCIFFAAPKAFRKKDAAAIRAKSIILYKKADFGCISHRFYPYIKQIFT